MPIISSNSASDASVRMHILGVRIDNITRNEALARCMAFLNDGEQHLFTTPNPEIIIDAQRDDAFRSILNSADLAIPDGFGLMLAGRILGQPIRERIAGSDFLMDICGLAERESASVYLFGASPGVAQRAGEALQKKYPKLVIAGTDNGPHLPASDCDIHTAISKIQNTNPHILFVAMGHGKQEKWIAAHLRDMSSVKIAMGVGGAFDFLAGTARRAPRFLRAMGLEWLWRLFCEPWRARRIFKAVIQFPLLTIREALSSKRHKS